MTPAALTTGVGPFGSLPLLLTLGLTVALGLVQWTAKDRGKAVWALGASVAMLAVGRYLWFAAPETRTLLVLLPFVVVGAIVVGRRLDAPHVRTGLAYGSLVGGIVLLRIVSPFGVLDSIRRSPRPGIVARSGGPFDASVQLRGSATYTYAYVALRPTGPLDETLLDFPERAVLELSRRDDVAALTWESPHRLVVTLRPEAIVVQHLPRFRDVDVEVRYALGPRRPTRSAG